MKELVKTIKQYISKNSLDLAHCASNLGIEETTLNGILDGTQKVGSDEKDRLMQIMEGKPKFNGKRIVKLLDLLFRLVAMVMALTVLLLCINGVGDTETLIALLSIGVVCSSFTILPRIDK